MPALLLLLPVRPLRPRQLVLLLHLLLTLAPLWQVHWLR